MPIKVVVEFQAKPGARAELKALLAGISETHGSQVPGWESAETQAAAVQQAMAAGVHAPVVELVAAPFRATRIGLS